MVVILSETISMSIQILCVFELRRVESRWASFYRCFVVNMVNFEGGLSDKCRRS